MLRAVILAMREHATSTDLRSPIRPLASLAGPIQRIRDRRGGAEQRGRQSKSKITVCLRHCDPWETLLEMGEEAWGHGMSAPQGARCDVSHLGVGGRSRMVERRVGRPERVSRYGRALICAPLLVGSRGLQKMHSRNMTRWGTRARVGHQ
jgi:hypothetical protein